MKIGVLTSSRADYGIYLPLLRLLKNDNFFDLEIIAFGSHLSKHHGYTLDVIEGDDYDTIRKISLSLEDDSDIGIAKTYANTTLLFAEFWKNNQYDLVLCLGDRFEMSAAVQAGIPFNIKLAHIHGGETTLGAVDNIYRHQITLASQMHFTSCELYRQRVISLVGSNKNTYAIGSLSLDGIDAFVPIGREILNEKFDLPKGEFALVTFHPETVAYNNTDFHSKEMQNSLKEVAKFINLVITMPNADTHGSRFRKALNELESILPDKIKLIENFGKDNYFSAMHYSKLLLGNTSSGIIEAASFGKFVVNVGDRQKGRAQSENILDAGFKADEIIDKTKKAIELGIYRGENIYFKEKAAQTIVKILKENEKL